MDILVIDGQGGGIGRELVSALRAALPELRIVAAGTNAMATSAMLKSGAQVAVTGENAIVYNCKRAHIITGPMGIVLAQSMYGELTPAMAFAVGEADAYRVLIPVGKSHTSVAGGRELPISQLIADAIRLITAFVEENTHE